MRVIVKYLGIWMSLLTLGVQAQISQPYQWTHAVDGNRLSIEVNVPAGTYLYAERTSVSVSGSARLLEQPVAHDHTDEFGTAPIFEGGQIHRWVFESRAADRAAIAINYQGCGAQEDGAGAICYPPASLTLGAPMALDAAETKIPENTSGQLNELLDKFTTVRSDGGIKNVDEMLAFLSLDSSSAPAASAGLLEGKGIILIIALVLLGGLALNLTPCVLPMIPVNLAIIGAGSAAATKRQGFIRGGVYGLGIAVAYGGLGIFTVLTGSKFGTLNASPAFNFSIALVFLVLTLAMFDVLNIDLSRFSSRMGGNSGNRAGLIPAFSMGIVAALLAGACVAPMVIAVLLQATAMYSAGNPAGLFLPFLLGIGMGLPWPIAGAGLAVLPKPGMWMVRVKHGFGILIAIMALYYGYLGYELLGGHDSEASPEQEIARLEQALQQALDEDKPVFIDFWASWCKNCLTMNATTFKDEQVITRLHDFQEIRFQAEDPGHAAIKNLMDRYELPGLPGYVVLVPNN